MKKKMSEETKKKISESMKLKKSAKVINIPQDKVSENSPFTGKIELADKSGRTIELKFENGILTGKV